MSTSKLPERASLEYLKKLAKDRLKQLRHADPHTQLAAAQLAVARDHGFSSWRAMKAEIDQRQTKPPISFFQACADGDLEALPGLLANDPSLARATNPESQYAGWTIQDSATGFFALGSGPARALSRVEALYKDDKAVLAWETGNEIYCPYSWTKEIAAYLKSIDANHLVWDGLYLGNKEIQPEALADPNIDIVSSHHYPGQSYGGAEMAEAIKRFHVQIAGRKVYVVGELGFIPVAGIEKVLDIEVNSTAMSLAPGTCNSDGGGLSSK
jgi:hypothetical protein